MVKTTACKILWCRSRFQNVVLATGAQRRVNHSEGGGPKRGHCENRVPNTSTSDVARIALHTLLNCQNL